MKTDIRNNYSLHNEIEGGNDNMIISGVTIFGLACMAGVGIAQAIKAALQIKDEVKKSKESKSEKSEE